MKKILMGALLFAGGFMFNEAVETYRDYHEAKMARINMQIRSERINENCKVRESAGFKTDEESTTGKIGFDTTGCRKE